MKEKTYLKLFPWYVLTLCIGSVLYLFSIMETTSVLITVLISFGVLPLAHKTITRRGDPLSPVVLLPFFYTLYALGPLNAVVQKLQRFGFSNETYISYLVLQLIGLIFMLVGLYWGSSLRFRALQSQACLFKPWPLSLLWVTSIGLLSLSIPSIASWLNAYGGLSGFLQTGWGGQHYLILREKIIIGTGFEWWLLGAVTLSFYGLKSRRKVWLLVGILLYAIVALLLLRWGVRSPVVYTMIFGLALYNYGHRKLPTLPFLLVLLIGISLAQYYAIARNFLSNGIIYALTRTLNMVVENPLLIAPWNADHFNAPAMSLLEVLQYGGPDLLLGQSYLGSLGAPIPFLSKLFQEVSFNLYYWRFSTFYPELLATGGGPGFSPVTEGYMNFGVIGIAVHMWLYGYIMSKIYTNYLSRCTVSSLLLLAGSLPIFMLDGFSVTTGSFVYKLVRAYLMPLVIYWFLAATARWGHHEAKSNNGRTK